MPAFMRLYPEVRLELILTESNLDMVAERIDLALRLSPRMAQDIVRVKWFDTAYKAVASPAYLREHAPVETPADLSSRRLVLFGHPEPQIDWRVRDPSGSEQQVTVSALMTVSNGLAQRELALAGVTPALLPIWLAAPELGAGRLVDLLPGCTAMPGDFQGAVWLLYPNRSFLPTKTRAMLEFLKEHTNPAWTIVS